MKLHSIIALAALAASFAVQAAEPVATPAKPAAGTVAPAKVAPSTAVDATPKAVTPQKTAATSQQDRMRACNKQATGKKGPERKAFMKTCLSSPKKA